MLFKKGHADLVPKSSRGHSEETKKKMAAAAERAGRDKERAVAQAVKKALEEQAAKEGSDE